MKIEEIYFNGFTIKKDHLFNNENYFDIYYKNKWLDICRDLHKCIKYIKNGDYNNQTSIKY